MTDRRKIKKTKYQRAYAYGVKVVPFDRIKYSAYIRAEIRTAWLKGYEAGRRDAAKWLKELI